MFAEFDGMLDRDTGVALLRSSGLKRGDKVIWATQDREPADRAARSYCFGVKYLLKNELQNPYTIRVSEEAPYTIHVGVFLH